MTYEGLAKRMTDLGCATHASSIYKIEKGRPPRKVTISELIALSKVFETTTDDLLVPLDLRHAKLASRIFRRVESVVAVIESATSELETASLEMKELASEDPRANEILSRYFEAEAVSESLTAQVEGLGVAVGSWLEGRVEVTKADIDALELRRVELGGEPK